MWPGETAFVVASGPSLRKFDLEVLRGRRTIVVNSTALRMPWADVLFFTDSGWFESHRAFVESWSGIVVSYSRSAKRDAPHKIKRVIGETRNRFRNLGATSIRQGRSSGQSAISLAIALGASTVVLLGFDMQVDATGRSHEHDDYKSKTPPVTFANEFLPAFAGWNQQALDAGVKILNATPGSALTEFPFVDLRQFLDGEGGRPSLVENLPS